MENLFEAINVTTMRSSAPQSCYAISHDKWQTEATSNSIKDCLDTNPGEVDMYDEAVDVVENALNNSYPGETVYFWID